MRKLFFGFLLALPIASQAQQHGIFGIDHRWNYDNDGIFNRKAQLAVEGLTLLTITGGALWEGGDNRLGKTYWQAIDAAALGTVSSSVMKLGFSRSRPTQSADPNLWFQGKGHYSFPSGEVTFISASVTPFVLEYGHENPWVYALELLPAYDAVARMKVDGHWQSDVLAGFVLGTAAGYLAHKQDNPWLLQALPGGFEIGLKKRFYGFFRGSGLPSGKGWRSTLSTIETNV